MRKVAFLECVSKCIINTVQVALQLKFLFLLFF